jgi:RecA/RadA recombinase
MASLAKIIELRQLLAQHFPTQNSPPAALIATGLPSFDQMLGGGLLRGAITQLIAPLPSTGSTLFLQEMIHALQQQAQLVALVDGADCFEPVSTADHLLWVRCRYALEAVKATDLLLRDGNIPVTILDLKQNRGAELQKIPGQIWYRLQRVAEETQTTLLLLTRHPLASSVGMNLYARSALVNDDLSTFSSTLIAALCFQAQRRKLFQEPAYAEI